MDTSKEYINMCEKAWEIQTLKRRWQTITEKFDKTAAEFDSHDIVVDCPDEICGYWHQHPWKWWLPRQDQLQEMVGIKKVFDGEWVQWLRFCVDDKWVIHEYPLRFRASMEQLWLAFVMKEKYGKVWSGEDWKPL